MSMASFSSLFVITTYHMIYVTILSYYTLTYKNVSVTIITKQWSTTHIPLKKGVYQGDPLSVILFNLVSNTLVDTLKQDLHHGLTLPKSCHQRKMLQFADDTYLLVKILQHANHYLTKLTNMATMVWYERKGSEVSLSRK